ncbi:hypothetical protein [Streptomyces sp. NPDC016172]|uniref:hypothetical protein n=1 Tax=Streptomyces sp. NPDC016172 TaxID=3364964 RepID=UPI0036FC55DD
MTENTAHGLSTRSVHAGERRDPEGAIHTPLYNHSTFAFDTTADLEGGCAPTRSIGCPRC